MTVEELKSLLGLVAHAQEGGFFAETWRSPHRLEAGALPGHPGARALGTAIYYLLTPDAFSEMHRLRSDEVFHFYMGDPVEMLQLAPGGAGRVVRLGTALAAGQRPQALVSAGVWQGSRLVPGGRYALLGTTVAPGFEPQDYERGGRAELSASWPEHAGLVAELTRA